MSDDNAITTAARRCADTRRVMLNAWRNEEFGRSYALDLMGIDPRQVVTENVEFADKVCRVNADALAVSVLYVADEDMVALLDTAAPTMPDQVLEHTDPLSPHGWLWFADPLPDRTGTEPNVPIKALSWSTLGPSSPLLDRWNSPTDENQGAILIHAYSDTLEFVRARMTYNNQPGEVSLAPGAAGLMPSASAMWNFESPIGTVFGRNIEDLQAESGTTEFPADPGFYQRVLAAFWTLSKQPLAETQEARIDTKSDRRKAAHAGVAEPSAPVRVLRLRHRQSAGKAYDKDTGRTVSVRFAVRGHWRNQFLPSTKSHRQQWIAPYLKGPEDAPLKGGERVFLAEGREAKR